MKNKTNNERATFTGVYRSNQSNIENGNIFLIRIIDEKNNIISTHQQLTFTRHDIEKVGTLQEGDIVEFRAICNGISKVENKHILQHPSNIKIVTRVDVKAILSKDEIFAEIEHIRKVTNGNVLHRLYLTFANLQKEMEDEELSYELRNEIERIDERLQDLKPKVINDEELCDELIEMEMPIVSLAVRCFNYIEPNSLEVDVE